MLNWGNIIGDNFPSWCNVFHGTTLILMIEGNLACIRFLLLCVMMGFFPLRELNLLRFLPQNMRQMKEQTIYLSNFRFKVNLLYQRGVNN